MRCVEGVQIMSRSYELTGWEWLEVRRLAPLFLYDDLRFGCYSVAEPDSNRPKHFARLLKLLTRKGRSREDAEDLIQEAMLRLHLYAKSDMVVNEEAFLIQAARNLAIDHYRHDRSTVGREMQLDDLDQQHPLIAPDPTPDQILDSQQCLDQLTTALDAISRRTREIYFAHRSGYTYAEIADEMGIAKMTVRRHIARAHLAITKNDAPLAGHRLPKVCRSNSCRRPTDCAPSAAAQLPATPK
jgi:RNA polymerase sigma factor (sigma-70 family)